MGFRFFDLCFGFLESLCVCPEGLWIFFLSVDVCMYTKELRVAGVRALFTSLSRSSKRDCRFDGHGGLGFLWAFMVVSKRRDGYQSGLRPSGS